jgi:hypothetical protein
MRNRRSFRDRLHNWALRPKVAWTLLVISCCTLILAGLIPFAPGFEPTFFSPTGSVFEEKTVSLAQPQSTVSISAGQPRGIPEAVFLYGGVEFTFILGPSGCPGPSSAEVSEYWGGSYTVTLGSGGPGNCSGWWISPDQLSGFQYPGGSDVTLLVAVSELAYGLPQAPAAALVAVNLGAVALAVYLLARIRRMRGPHGPP